ncbi:MAG: ATP-binding cassette domain-containing protein [Alphaproteobacteria bacterium]
MTDDPDAGPESMTAPSLKLSNISKRYPGVQALNGVGLECVAGEVHAVVGENGSGKSTLLGIASGTVAPDEGTVEILGVPLDAADPSLARKLGLATVYQDDSLVRELSVAQNLQLGTLGRTMSYAGMRARAKALLDRYDLALDPDALVSELSPSQRQFLEVVKALAARPKVLLLDEPTTSLDLHDVEKLHAIVRRLVEEGATVVYVSHRLPEILSLADRMTVLRDGEGQGTYDTATLTEEAIIALMVGRPIEAEFPAKRGARPGESGAVLAVRDLAGEPFGGVSFEAQRGEIIGLAGAEGNGQREVLRALCGFEAAAGEVICDGRRVPLNAPKGAIAAGVMMLSGDRAAESIFPVLGVRENMTVQVLRRFSRVGLVSGARERRQASALIDELDIATATLDQPIRTLSGGNQQKAVLARSFLHDAKVIMIDEPTQGVDAKARFDIYQALRAKADQGATIILKSADAIELAGLCDRVLVFSRGRIIRELKGDEVTEPNIVSSFLTSRTGRAGSTGAAAEAEAPQRGSLPGKLWRLLGPGPQWWKPSWFLLVLIVIVGAYASSQSNAFLTPLNARHLLLATAPLALVSMAQLNVLLVGGFDMSVGSLMTLTVVIASFLITSGAEPGLVLGGALLCLGAGIAVGSANGAMVRRLHINPVITTIAMLSVLQGIALHLRPIPGGAISAEFMGALTARAGFLPYSFLGLIGLAILADFWLYRSRSGLKARAVGFREEAARRNGIWTGLVHFRAYVMSGLLAALAGLFLSTEVGVGHPTIGATYTLTSIAAAVLGGAALSGGRGSFLGALLGAIFFALIINIMPFLGVHTALGIIVSGALTLLAVLIYSGRLPTGRLWLYLRGALLPRAKWHVSSDQPMGRES